MTEVWKKIPTLIGYEASSLGRIRSIDRHIIFFAEAKNNNMKHAIVVEKNRLIKGKILKQKYYPLINPYKFFGANRDENGKRQTMAVHRAVCLAFHGNPPNRKSHAAHLDGNEINNIPENLKWVTCAENHGHKHDHGTMSQGSDRWNSKLSPEDIKNIFYLYSTGVTPSDIKKIYKITESTVRAIVQRKRWKHIIIDQEIVDKCKYQAKQNILLRWK